MVRRRRSSDSDSASSGGSSDTLVMIMAIVLTGGFALLAFPDLLKGFGGTTGGSGCSNATTKAAGKAFIAANIATYVRNHLNKQITLSAAQLAQRIITSYPSGIDSLNTQNGCKTTLPAGNGGFYKLYATIALRIAPQLGTGVNLSSGALAAMTAMSKDGGRAHLTAYTTSYPGMTGFELERLAQDYGYGYSQVMSDYGRSYVGIAEEEDIVKKVANEEDYETIGKSL